MLLGWITDDGIYPAKIKLVWVTLFFIPIMPLRGYVIGPLCQVKAEVSIAALFRIYRWRLTGYYATVLVESAARAAVMLLMFLLVGSGLYWLRGQLF